MNEKPFYLVMNKLNDAGKKISIELTDEKGEPLRFRTLAEGTSEASKRAGRQECIDVELRSDEGGVHFRAYTVGKFPPN